MHLMGKIIADFFVTDSGGKGNAVIEHVPAYPILGGFTDGFQAEVKSKCPDCKIKITNITIPDLAAGKVAEHAGVGAAVELGRQLPGVRRRPVRDRHQRPPSPRPVSRQGQDHRRGGRSGRRSPR